MWLKSRRGKCFFSRDNSVALNKVLSLFNSCLNWHLSVDLLANKSKTFFQGLYTAARDRNIRWAVIKGVSYFIDGREPNTHSWRKFASALAASLTFNILKDTNVFKAWPHHKSEYTNIYVVWCWEIGELLQQLVFTNWVDVAREASEE